MSTSNHTSLDKETSTLDWDDVKADNYYAPIIDVESKSLASDTQPVDVNSDMAKIRLRESLKQPYYQPQQSWEGVVLEVFEDSFRARLVDIMNSDIQEEAEIFKSALSDEDDHKLLKPGAIFYWSIGKKIEGRRSYDVSDILFRRLPNWTEKELEKAKQEAKEIKTKLGW